jgi:hypothetical protein
MSFPRAVLARMDGERAREGGDRWNAVWPDAASNVTASQRRSVVQVSSPPDASGLRSPRRTLAAAHAFASSDLRKPLQGGQHPGWGHADAGENLPAARRDTRVSPQRTVVEQGIEHSYGARHRAPLQPGRSNGAGPAWKLAHHRNGSQLDDGMRPAAPGPLKASPLQLSCIPDSRRMLATEEKYQFNTLEEHGLPRRKIPAR